ncbi:hypothetical protein ABTM32_21040, partial [Acinetobacter baumannii]
GLYPFLFVEPTLQEIDPSIPSALLGETKAWTFVRIFEEFARNFKIPGIASWCSNFVTSIKFLRRIERKK